MSFSPIIEFNHNASWVSIGKDTEACIISVNPSVKLPCGRKGDGSVLNKENLLWGATASSRFRFIKPEPVKLTSLWVESLGGELYLAAVYTDSEWERAWETGQNMLEAVNSIYLIKGPSGVAVTSFNHANISAWDGMNPPSKWADLRGDN